MYTLVERRKVNRERLQETWASRRQGRKMRSSPPRLLLGLALALALSSGAFAAGAAQPARAPATWQVKIGAESPDQALQAQAYGPTTITVNVGDTVNWTLNAFVHTVTFLSGGERPADFVPAGADNLVMENPAVAFPSGGPTYDGTGFANSGTLQEKGAQFALTFTKAGSYGYVCLLHLGMAATVVVQAEGSPYPMTQAQIDAQANQELNAKVALAEQHRASAHLTSQPNADGTSSYTVVNGIGGNQATVLRFLPGEVTVKAGDSISWPVRDPHEAHTVTFYDPAGQVPPFIEPRPQPAGPPQLLVPHAAPSGGTRVESQGLYNSGILGPGQSYTFTFPKAGTYSYVCILHAPQGMFGNVTVQAAAQPAPLPLPETGEELLPVALPDTGTPSPRQANLPLLAGSLLLLLGLLVTRRLARRP
jgi:plastocyanin